MRSYTALARMTSDAGAGRKAPPACPVTCSCLSFWANETTEAWRMARRLIPINERVAPAESRSGRASSGPVDETAEEVERGQGEHEPDELKAEAAR